MRNALLLILGSCLSSFPAAIDVYMAPPGVTNTPIAGATVETFDTMQVRQYRRDISSAIGTYQLDNRTRVNVVAPDQYGGARDSNGVGTRYLAFGAQSGYAEPVPLIFQQPQDYFGFWWSAGDANNTLTFYSGSLILARFATADILTFLRATQVEALDGTRYNTADYFGKPGATPRPNSAEPYVYLSFVIRGGRFERVVFGNSGSTGTGFESDNHAIYAGAFEIPQSQIYVDTLSPEPGTFFLAGIVLLAGGLWGRRRHKRQL